MPVDHQTPLRGAAQRPETLGALAASAAAAAVASVPHRGPSGKGLVRPLELPPAWPSPSGAGILANGAAAPPRTMPDALAPPATYRAPSPGRSGVVLPRQMDAARAAALDKAMSRPVIVGEPLRPSAQPPRRSESPLGAPSSDLYRSLASPLAAAAASRLGDQSALRYPQPVPDPHAVLSRPNPEPARSVGTPPSQQRAPLASVPPPPLQPPSPPAHSHGDSSGAVPIPNNPYLLDTLRMAGGDVAAWSSWKAGTELGPPDKAPEDGATGAPPRAAVHERTETFVEKAAPPVVDKGAGIAPWAGSELPTMKL